MYEWLVEKKAEAMKEKLQKRGMPSYSQLPIRDRYGVSYTGLGSNNKLDVSSPAGMAGSHIFHEGETRATFPEGNMYLDADTTAMTYPETQQQQAQMKMYEKSGTLPGFQTGGAQLNATDEIVKNVTNAASQVTVSPQTRLAGSAVEPTMIKPIESQNVTVTPQIRNEPGTNQQVYVQPQTREQPVVEPVKVRPIEPKTITVEPQQREPETTTAQPTVYIPPQTREQPVVEPVKIRPIEQTVAPRLAGSEAITETAEEKARRTGLEYLQGTLTGENKATMLEGRRAIDELTARQKQEISALRQQYAQQGIDSATAESLIQQRINSQESERNDLAAQYGIAGMRARETAASSLASQGLAGQQFEQAKKQYGDTKAWQDFEYATQYGSDADVISAYKAATGKELDPSAVAEIRGYARTRREQELQGGTLSLDAQKIANQAASLGVSTDKLTAFVNAVNNGADLATANSTSGLNLTQGQFDSIKSSTALGQMEWQHKLSAANMLLQTQDPKNIEEASRMFGEIFPGVTFNVDQLISDIGAERFSTGMTDIATLASTYNTWDEAKSSVQGMNLMKTMGIDENQAKQMFQGLKINAIDEEWNTIANSDVFKTMPVDTQDLIKNTFIAGLSGELEFDITPVYNITDANGNFVKSYSNIVDANKFIGENADKGYTVQKKSNYVYRNMVTGDTVVVNNQTGETTTGATETVDTALAQIQKEGGDYTAEDVSTYKTEKGKLPTSKEEMDKWDEQRKNVALFTRLDDEYPDGILTEEGTTPSISKTDAEKISEAYKSGDARASKYYVDERYANVLNPSGSTMDQILAKMYNVEGLHIVNGDGGGVEGTLHPDSVQAINDSIGKMIEMPNGNNYIILGTTTLTAAGTRTVDNPDVGFRNAGGMLVYNIETGKRETISPFTNSNMTRQVANVINQGYATTVDEAIKYLKG